MEGLVQVDFGFVHTGECGEVAASCGPANHSFHIFSSALDKHVRQWNLGFLFVTKTFIIFGLSILRVPLKVYSYRIQK